MNVIKQMFYGHSKADCDRKKWQRLDAHLDGVARKVRELADKLKYGDCMIYE